MVIFGQETYILFVAQETRIFYIFVNSNLHENLLDFDSGKGVVKPVAEEDDERETFSLLVGTLGWFWRVNSSQLIQHPMGWSIKTLQVLLLTTRHDILGPNFYKKQIPF